MKFTSVIALFTLSVIVKGNLIAAAARPAILAIGTIFAALNQVDREPIEWSNFMPFAMDKT